MLGGRRETDLEVAESDDGDDADADADADRAPVGSGQREGGRESGNEGAHREHGGVIGPTGPGDLATARCRLLGCHRPSWLRFDRPSPLRSTFWSSTGAVSVLERRCAPGWSRGSRSGSCPRTAWRLDSITRAAYCPVARSVRAIGRRVDNRTETVREQPAVPVVRAASVRTAGACRGEAAPGRATGGAAAQPGAQPDGGRATSPCRRRSPSTSTVDDSVRRREQPADGPDRAPDAAVPRPAAARDPRARPDHRDVQPEGWRRQDDDHHQPWCGARGVRTQGAARRLRPAGLAVGGSRCQPARDRQDASTTCSWSASVTIDDVVAQDERAGHGSAAEQHRPVGRRGAAGHRGRSRAGALPGARAGHPRLRLHHHRLPALARACSPSTR